MNIVDTSGRTIHESKAETMGSAIQEAVREGKDLFGADFRGHDFSNQNFEADMESCDFRGCKLLNTRFSGRLSSSNFSGTTLTDVIFEGSLESACFEKTVLTRVSLWGNCEDIKCNGALLSYCSGDGTNFSRGGFDHARIEHGAFRNSKMNDIHALSLHLIDSNFYNAEFEGAFLGGSQFAHSALEGASFSGAMAAGSMWKDLNVSMSSFDDANLSGTRMEDVRMEKCNFSGVEMCGLVGSGRLVFAYSDFNRGARLSGSCLPRADFNAVDWDGVDACGARLAGSSFINGFLQDCKFAGADLTACRLLVKNGLAGCTFEGAKLLETELPARLAVQDLQRKAMFYASAASERPAEECGEEENEGLSR